MDANDVDNYFLLLDNFEEGEAGEEQQQEAAEAPEAPEAPETGEDELGWAVDTNATDEQVGETDFEEYAADLANHPAWSLEAEVDAEAEEALAAEAALAEEAAQAAAAFGVEDEVPDFEGELVQENGTAVDAVEEVEEEGEEDEAEQADDPVAEVEPEQPDTVDTGPSRKRARDAEDEEMLSTVTPAALLGKLRRLDPQIATEEQYMVDGDLEAEALAEDFKLTKTYSAQALEETLKPMQEAVKRVQSRVTFPETTSLVEVYPGTIMLADAAGCKDIPALRRFQVKKVINCSPQTVRDTGSSFYGPNVEYLELWQDDFADYCLLHDFDVAWSFSFSGTDGCVLLHCEQGVNRSCALALALRMRLVRDTQQMQDPETLLRTAWCHVAARKQRVLINQSFQRQLLLFARMGCRWFPSLEGVWRTVSERHMAQFRSFVEELAKEIVCGHADFPSGSWWRAIVYIRDGVMRVEQKQSSAFELSSAASRARATSRVKTYAATALPKLAAAAAAASKQIQINIRKL